MGDLWKGSALVAAVMALALFAGIVMAQAAVTVFTGSVTLNGTAAPVGTVVNLTSSTVTATNAAVTGPASAFVSETIASRPLETSPGPGS